MIRYIHMVLFLLLEAIDDTSYDDLLHSYGSVFVVRSDK